MSIVPNTQIAAGHNNAAGLARWDAITDANSVPFHMPQQLPFRIRGQVRYRLNGSVARVGQNSTAFLFSYMTVAQLALIYSTYEGLMTVKIALTSTTYANYNCTVIAPDEDELTFHRSAVRQDGYTFAPWYENVRLEVHDLEAL